MNFNISRFAGYKGFSVEFNGAKIDLGLLNEKERSELAYKLREAALELDGGEGKEYTQPGLEKALELVKDYISALKIDNRINEILWVDVIREHIEDELGEL